MSIVMLKTRDGDEPMQFRSHALRPARIVNEDLRHFTGTTFPENPLQGCSLVLRRLEAFGMIADAVPTNGSMCWLTTETSCTKCQ
ncbi:hypothetical protein CR105_27155 [Massilia eurypsychrophila]|uniref:Uncharacterized protein n=1 Tax=Massilia eurypsychrophila TaxID=1485217 RepID=A0A2G8T7D6_9BURK|nr:hypothetical protein [Massilia eurypsychrophila]PIL41914.1 hypothetical protein CR105_27155 [Massilia eurypsychrophila]